MNTDKKTNLLEKDLDDLLNPVSPSKDFVDELHSRLKSKSQVVVEYPDYFIPIILISMGLFLGITLIWGLNKLFRMIAPNDLN